MKGAARKSLEIPRIEELKTGAEIEIKDWSDV